MTTRARSGTRAPPCPRRRHDKAGHDEEQRHEPDRLPLREGARVIGQLQLASAGSHGDRDERMVPAQHVAGSAVDVDAPVEVPVLGDQHENWYLDWRVNVDGTAGHVLRGDHALITVPVGPGARKLELTYYSRSFAKGKAIGLVTLLLVMAGFVVPPAWARRRPR